MQLRKVEGLEDLLRSLSLDEMPGKSHHVVYPWHKYSKKSGADIGFWYLPRRCQYQTLRRIICQALAAVGHPQTDNLADGVALTFVLMPKSSDEVLVEFEKVLT